MITGLDAITLGARNPRAAARAYGLLLGRLPDPAAGAGDAPRFTLANTAIRIVEVESAAEGLSGLTFAVSDLEQARGNLVRRGLTFSDSATLDPWSTGGVAISLVERATPPSPPTGGTDGVVALDHVVIHTSNPDRAVAVYGARLGLDFRLDRANRQWGSRLMFFRCGEAMLEIAAPLDGLDPAQPDRLDGLAWRVTDTAAARARLAGGGFDVSEVRKGRKPGTSVFTLRAGVLAAPALLIGPE